MRRAKAPEAVRCQTPATGVPATGVPAPPTLETYLRCHYVYHCTFRAAFGSALAVNESPPGTQRPEPQPLNPEP